MSDQPNITGPWTSDDTSSNRLELAITDQVAKGGNGSQGQPVLAMRDTAQPGQILYVTHGQLRQFMNSAQRQDSSVSQVLTAAGSGGSSRA